jgi:hypothetical protein
MEQETLEVETDDISKTDDLDDVTVLKHKSQNATQDSFGATPLEDRYGRSLWAKTRECFCDINAPTDCRFHPVTKPGWKKCPGEALAKSSKRIGRWLWARNPLYGKPLSETEILMRASAVEET